MNISEVQSLGTKIPSVFSYMQQGFLYIEKEARVVCVRLFCSSLNSNWVVTAGLVVTLSLAYFNKNRLIRMYLQGKVYLHEMISFKKIIVDLSKISFQSNDSFAEIDKKLESLFSNTKNYAFSVRCGEGRSHQQLKIVISGNIRDQRITEILQLLGRSSIGPRIDMVVIEDNEIWNTSCLTSLSDSIKCVQLGERTSFITQDLFGYLDQAGESLLEIQFDPSLWSQMPDKGHSLRENIEARHERILFSNLKGESISSRPSPVIKALDDYVLGKGELDLSKFSERDFLSINEMTISPLYLAKDKVDTIVACLVRCRYLKGVTFRGCHHEESQPIFNVIVSSHSILESIAFSKCCGLNQQQIHLLSICPRLKELSIDSCLDLTQPVFDELGRSCFNCLYKLSYFGNFSSSLIFKMPLAAPELKELFLANCSLERGLGVFQQTNHEGRPLFNLDTLSLKRVLGLDFSQNFLPSLTTLSIIESIDNKEKSGLTDSDCEALQRYHPNLKCLTLDSCPKVTNRGISCFMNSPLVSLDLISLRIDASIFSSRCMSLQEIRVERCPGLIFKSALTYLESLLPRIKRLEFILSKKEQEISLDFLKKCRLLDVLTLSGSLSCSQDIGVDLNRIHSLGFVHADFSPTLLGSLARIDDKKKMEKLVMYDAQYPTRDLSRLLTGNSIRELSLKSQKLSDEDLNFLLSDLYLHSQLAILDLSGNDVGELALSQLRNYAQLKILILNGVEASSSLLISLPPVLEIPSLKKVFFMNIRSNEEERITLESLPRKYSYLDVSISFQESSGGF